jgi:hypothetical protein
MNAFERRLGRLESEIAPPRQVVLRTIVETGQEGETGDQLVAAHLRDHPEDANAEFLVIHRVIV